VSAAIESQESNFFSYIMARANYILIQW